MTEPKSPFTLCGSSLIVVFLLLFSFSARLFLNSSSHKLPIPMDEFANLPLDERLVHKVWKVRLQAYEQLTAQFAEDSSSFDIFSNVDLIKTIITDANVVAQEAGIGCIAAYLDKGATLLTVPRLRSAGVVSLLTEKGLASSRASTKAKTTECLLSMVELASNTASIHEILEDILASTSARLPKLVAGSVGAVTAIVDNFGCVVVPPQPIVPYIPKLFAHADRNVRAEATKLCVVLYQWLGDAVSTMVFSDLKPVQQKDLTKAFESTERTSTQKRLTRVQQHQQQQQKQLNEPDNQQEAADQPEQQDVSMTETFDAFDVIPPVDALSKFPSNFYSQIQSSQWKERKETLEEVHAILEKSARLEPSSDYTDFARVLAKCLRDANIIVVQLAANCVEFLARGLREGFLKYRLMVLEPLVERTKEKKASVAEALNAALDTLFQFSVLSDVLAACISGMNSKVPQVKISSTDYLRRCLLTTKHGVDESEISVIMSIASKLLADSQEPVRQAATQMVGTLMKLTGQRPLKSYLEKVDDNRKAKVMKAYEAAQVNFAGIAVPSRQPSTQASQQTANRGSQPETSRKLALPGSLKQSIPSKRGATSPAKRDDLKTNQFGRRPLPSSIPKLEPPQPSNEPSFNHADLKELEQLRHEKEQWNKEKVLLTHAQERLALEKTQLAQQLDLLQQRLQESSRDSENSSLLLKQKDTQILRLNSDLETAKLKIRDLDQTIEMMRLQQNSTQLHFSHSPVQPYPVSTRLTSGELSSRVHRLSIEGETEASPQRRTYETTKETESTNDDSWSHAAEITSQLKARIEKMKATRRGMS